MYVTLKSGKTALVGRWPTIEEQLEIDKQLPSEMSYKDRAVIILDQERPATLEDIKRLETKMTRLTRLKSGRGRQLVRK